MRGDAGDDAPVGIGRAAAGIRGGRAARGRADAGWPAAVMYVATLAFIFGVVWLLTW